jgi:Methane/Phenol/Toluene Hydroxylase
MNLCGSTATGLPARCKPRKNKFMDTRNPEGPHRPPLKTWSAFGNLGRRPSEYEIVTHKMNHTLRETPLELGPDSPGNLWLVRHRDSVALRVQDWNAFRDPDQLTYRKYVTCQDKSETYLDATFEAFARIGRAESGPEFLQTCLTPTRYLAHGLQMMSAYLQQLAPSSYVGNCAAFQTGDQLRRVQRVAYRTKQLDRAYPERLFGKTERMAWEQLPEWQGLRKGIERLLVTFDWDEVFVGLNLVVKPLADELTLRQFAIVARHLSAELDALVADDLFLDAERSHRWSAALTRFAIADDCANRKHLEALVAKWRPLADEIVETGSRLLGSFSSGLNSDDQIAAAATAAWQTFLHGAGLQSESAEFSK